VSDGVGVGVAAQPFAVRNLDAAEDEFAPGGEGMRVVPDPDAH